MPEKPPYLVALEAEARRPLKELAKIPPGVTPFDPGGVAVEIGDIAVDMLDALAQPFEGGPGDRPGYSGKYRALVNLIEMESLVQFIDAPDEASDDAVRQARISRTLLELHVALPFNEAERGWLDRLSNEYGKSENSSELLPDFVEQHDERIMVAGIRQVVSGRDLMRRWLSWRREADEYEGQGAVDAARGALTKLIGLVGHSAAPSPFWEK